MRFPPIRHLRRQAPVLMVGAFLLVVCACSTKAKPTTESHTSSTVPSSTGTTAPPKGATPRPTPAAAVQALLDAERRGDHASSYRLLSAGARTQYHDVTDWGKRRSQVPPITSFTIGTVRGSGGVASVVTQVRHTPALDPFVGLSAERERETWTAHRAGSGWLVDGDPSINYELPADAGAASSALRWARAVQACDRTAARALQAINDLYTTGAPTPRLCRAKGTVTVGRVMHLQAGPSASDLIAQYSSDVLAWARVVHINAPSVSFSVVLAPLGQVWKIVGLSD